MSLLLWPFLFSSVFSTMTPCSEFPANSEDQRSSVPAVGRAGSWTARNERLCSAYLDLALEMRLREAINNTVTILIVEVAVY